MKGIPLRQQYLEVIDHKDRRMNYKDFPLLGKRGKKWSEDLTLLRWNNQWMDPVWKEEIVGILFSMNSKEMYSPTNCRHSLVFDEVINFRC